jgi:hypothetical protein
VQGLPAEIAENRSGQKHKKIPQNAARSAGQAIF